MRQGILFLSFFFLLVQPALAAEAKGKFELNGKTVTLSEAASFSFGGDKISLVLSDKPLPEGYRQPGKGVQGVSFLIQAGKVEKIALFQGGEFFSTQDTRGIELTTDERSETTISGKISMKKVEPGIFMNASLDVLDAQFATDIKANE